MDTAGSGFVRSPERLNATRDSVSAGDVTVLLEISWRHRRLIGSCIVAGLAAGLCFQLLKTPIYSSTEQVTIDFRRLMNVNPTEATFNYRLSDAAVDSQTAIMTSGGVLGRAVDALKLTQDPEFIGEPNIVKSLLVRLGIIADPNLRTLPELRQDAIDALTKVINPERVGLSYVIELTASSEDPAKAVRLADAVTNAFIADQIDARKEVATGAADWFQGRLNQLQQRVAEAEHEAVDFRSKNQIMLAGGRYVDELQVQDLSLRMIASEERKVSATTRLQRVSAVIDSYKAGDGVLNAGLDDDTKNLVIVGLLGQYHDTAQRMAENLARYGAAHEAVLRDQATMGEIQKEVLSEFKRIAEGYRSEADIATREQQALADMLKQVSQHSTDAQKARIELIILQGAADTYSALRDKFISEYSTSTQEQTFAITETRILSRGSLPLKPTSPVLRKTLVGGMAAGLFAGFFFALGQEVLSHKLRKRRQLEDASGSRCLGYVPTTSALAGLSHGRADFLSSASGADKLAIWTMRSTLLYAQSSGAAVIGIIGTMESDGASTFASALAMVAATDGKRVLLIDADRYNRVLTQRFASSADYGLAEALKADELSPYLTRIDGFDDLWILPNLGTGHAGDVVLGSDEMAALVRRARSVHDVVIVDLSALGATLDARMMANDIEAYVLVTNWNKTKFETVIDCLASNPEVEKNLLGAIYNNVSMRNISAIEDVALNAMTRSSRSLGAIS